MKTSKELIKMLGQKVKIGNLPEAMVSGVEISPPPPNWPYETITITATIPKDEPTTTNQPTV